MNPASFNLDELRQDGARAFAAHGLPGRRVEAWKYTPLNGLEPAVEGGHSVAPTLVGDPPPGVSVVGLDEALAAGHATLLRVLGSLETTLPSQSLSALNNSALGQGLYVHVPAGVDGGRLEWCWETGSGTAMKHSRICMVLEAGARLELLERYAAGVEAALNVVIQVSMGAGARLKHARLQGGSPAPALVTRTEIVQEEGSSYAYTGLDLDGQLARHDLRAQLRGRGAECAMNGAYLPRGTCHVDNHLEIEHQAPDCTSSQFFRGVLDDRARAVFNGRVHVHPGADGTEARQSNANLLLSDRAEVDTKPELEIEADEVVASHGATVGQLDEDAVFYLRTRGLGEDAARQLLTGAFCNAVIDRMDEGPSRDALSAALADALGAAP